MRYRKLDKMGPGPDPAGHLRLSLLVHSFTGPNLSDTELHYLNPKDFNVSFAHHFSKPQGILPRQKMIHCNM